jgi:mono/diheme cytochrome c family protein
MGPRLRFALKLMAGLATGGAVLGLALLYSGIYDVSAIDQHVRPVHWALDTGMRQAVRARAAKIQAPALDDPALGRRGQVLYRESCAKCHGAPGVAPDPFALGLMPQPNNLAQTALEWTPSELYWVTRNGLKMTAMPAWEFRYPDADLWAIVAFVRQLPRLTAAQYAELDLARPVNAAPDWGPESAATKTGDPKRGQTAIYQYGCASCHLIPGIVGAAARVGPSLDGVASRRYLGGRLPNTPENLVRWISHPKEASPQTLMPELGITEAHARDIAAYLATGR